MFSAGESGLARVAETGPSCMTVILYPLESPFHTCLLQMREDRIPRGPCDHDPYVARSSSSDAKARLLPHQRPHANRSRMKQNLCHHEQESDDHLMLQYNNDIAV